MKEGSRCPFLTSPHKRAVKFDHKMVELRTFARAVLNCYEPGRNCTRLKGESERGEKDTTFSLNEIHERVRITNELPDFSNICCSRTHQTL